MSVRLILLSDTHGFHPYVTVPDGDIRIHAGDLTMHGTRGEVAAFNAWLGRLPHRHKVVIAGNHDFCFENQPEAAAAQLTHAIYLQDQAVALAGLQFYGSPWQPEFCDLAVNLPRGAALREKWNLISAGTDVLITHGPPLGHGDLTTRGEQAGCEELLAAVKRLKPRLHVFGHIHEGVGRSSDGPTEFVNACTCDADNVPVNPPIQVTYAADGRGEESPSAQISPYPYD